MSSRYHSSTSFSFSYSSSSASDAQATGKAYRKTTQSTPQGTKVQTTSHSLGEMPVQETKYFDREGRQVLESGKQVGSGAYKQEVGRIQGVEDVRDEE